jgi:hypothetical protein
MFYLFQYNQTSSFVYTHEQNRYNYNHDKINKA